MSQHTPKATPGPWSWKPESELDYNDEPMLLGRDGASVCDFGNSEQYYPTSGCGPEPADARLIAAAPELLAALKTLVYDYELLLGDGITDSTAPPLLKDAHAAIAKAESA